ncbi:hypothetical protein FRB91_007921 [Serendipita sp. 411]|nr:hypothetical protein FRC19_011524 [Serendipita sp. 401]KAG8851432.1 hypothetical protein FRB91_007921 [Serendipita sp. 411]KAG9052211.1 hypothetical protein FS842_010332 [Serendipita sp. 407]
MEALYNIQKSVIALHGYGYIVEEGKRFRTELKKEWETIADILQEHRSFNDDVQMLHNSIGRMTHEECMEFMEDMEALSASLSQRNETLYGDGKLCSSPYDHFFVGNQDIVYGLEPDVEDCDSLCDNATYRDGLTARNQFSSASKGIREAMIQFRNFWNEQNTFVKKSLANLKEGKIDVAYQEAKQYAEQWSIYDEAALSARAEIIRVCDAVTIEPTNGNLCAELNHVAEDSTTEENHTSNLDFASLGRAIQVAGPFVAYCFSFNADPMPKYADFQTQTIQHPLPGPSIQEAPKPTPVQSALGPQPRPIPTMRPSPVDNRVEFRQNTQYCHVGFTPDRPLPPPSPPSPHSFFGFE